MDLVFMLVLLLQEPFLSRFTREWIISQLTIGCDAKETARACETWRSCANCYVPTTLMCFKALIVGQMVSWEEAGMLCQTNPWEISCFNFSPCLTHCKFSGFHQQLLSTLGVFTMCSLIWHIITARTLASSAVHSMAGSGSGSRSCTCAYDYP